MPVITAETRESIFQVEKVIQQYIPDPILQYKFFRDLQKSLNIDDRGKVSFTPHLLNYRRRSVNQLFSGENHEEVARTLGVPVDTVKNDIRYNYDHSHKKK